MAISAGALGAMAAGSAAGGVASAGGGIIGSVLDWFNADKQRTWATNENVLQRDFNAAEAQKQRDWEQYMSNTAYQRQVEDMRSAGINPGLVNGSGASAPGGAAASGGANASGSGSNLGIGTIFSKLSAGATSGLMSAMLKTSRDNVKEFQQALKKNIDLQKDKELEDANTAFERLFKEEATRIYNEHQRDSAERAAKNGYTDTDISNLVDKFSNW